MNDYITFIIFPIAITAFAYWGTSFLWFILDFAIAPEHRVNKYPIDWNLYKKTALHVFYMQMSVTPVVMYTLIPVWKYIEINTTLWDLFTFYTAIKLLITPVLSDITFYYLHRITHLSFFYKNVHQLHHEWKTPSAVCAAYTTYYEFTFCNLPTFLLPVFILRLNWYAANLWFIFATVNVVNDHSGYVFFERSVHHALHHKFVNYNYGSKYLDIINGTIIKYIQNKKSKYMQKTKLQNIQKTKHTKK